MMSINYTLQKKDAYRIYCRIFSTHHIVISLRTNILFLYLLLFAKYYTFAKYYIFAIPQRCAFFGPLFLYASSFQANEWPDTKISLRGFACQSHLRGSVGLKNVDVQLSSDIARLMEFLRGRLGDSRGVHAIFVRCVPRVNSFHARIVTEICSFRWQKRTGTSVISLTITCS